MAKEVGRPIVHDRQKLLEAIEKYIDETPIPIVSEFAYLNGLNRTSVYEIEELSDAIKKLVSKKEVALERLGLSGAPNVSPMAIFSLKQLGWKDKQEIEHSGGLDMTSMSQEEFDRKAKEILEAFSKTQKDGD